MTDRRVSAAHTAPPGTTRPRVGEERPDDLRTDRAVAMTRGQSLRGIYLRGWRPSSTTATRQRKNEAMAENETTGKRLKRLGTFDAARMELIVAEDGVTEWRWRKLGG